MSMHISKDGCINLIRTWH